MSEAHSKEEIKKSFSLSQLAQNLAAQLQKTYASKYWIRCEIGKLNHYPQSGHAYPQLLEKKEGAIVADLRGFIGKHTFTSIQEKFREVTGKSLDDGLQVLVLCKLNYHPVYGLSLHITDIEPSYTLGEMARLRLEAINKLKSAGLFNRNKAIPLPLLVKRLAIVSVETSKGYHDFREVFNHSTYSEAISFQLFPALLQGDAAVGSIQKALAQIAVLAEQFDAVAIIRGGGGETGLDCYDHYALAQSVCTFPIPVLTGIGHATNNTVVEQVAHQHFLTPTHLAQNLIQKFEDFENRLKASAQALAQFSKLRLQGEKEGFRAFADRLKHCTQDVKFNEHSRLNNIAAQLLPKSAERIQSAKFSLTYQYPNMLSQGLDKLLNGRERRLEQAKSELALGSSERSRTADDKLKAMAEKLRILDPQNILKRGFTISQVEGKTLNDICELKAGQELQTTFWNGKAISTIQEIKQDD